MSTAIKKEDDSKNKFTLDKIRYDPEEYLIRKRLPTRYPSRAVDVYVNTKTDFKAQLARCFKCLESENSIYIHGLGAAVSIAVNLALQVQLKSVVPVNISVNTSTVELIDDLEPQTDTATFQSQGRQNSAVHIRLSRCEKLMQIL